MSWTCRSQVRVLQMKGKIIVLIMVFDRCWCEPLSTDFAYSTMKYAFTNSTGYRDKKEDYLTLINF